MSLFTCLCYMCGGILVIDWDIKIEECWISQDFWHSKRSSIYSPRFGRTFETRQTDYYRQKTCSDLNHMVVFTVLRQWNRPPLESPTYLEYIIILMQQWKGIGCSTTKRVSGLAEVTVPHNYCVTFQLEVEFRRAFTTFFGNECRVQKLDRKKKHDHNLSTSIHTQPGGDFQFDWMQKKFPLQKQTNKKTFTNQPENLASERASTGRRTSTTAHHGTDIIQTLPPLVLYHKQAKIFKRPLVDKIKQTLSDTTCYYTHRCQKSPRMHTEHIHITIQPPPPPPGSLDARNDSHNTSLWAIHDWATFNLIQISPRLSLSVIVRQQAIV